MLCSTADCDAAGREVRWDRPPARAALAVPRAAVPGCEYRAGRSNCAVDAEEATGAREPVMAVAQRAPAWAASWELAGYM